MMCCNTKKQAILVQYWQKREQLMSSNVNEEKTYDKHRQHLTYTFIVFYFADLSNFIHMRRKKFYIVLVYVIVLFHRFNTNNIKIN